MSRQSSHYLASHYPARFSNAVDISWFLLLGLVAAGAQPASARADQAKTEREQEATVLVTHALDAEAEGKTSDRKELLEWALEKLPEFAPALWHSGFVRVGKNWVKTDDVPAIAAAKKELANYRDLRQKYPQTADGQLRLARWCGQHKLPDEERAHLTKVLELDPNNAEARQRLHYVFLAGKWHSEEDLRAAAAQADRTVASLKKWSARLQPLVKAFDQTNGRSATAASRLQAIRDPGAIPALEAALSELNEPTSRLLIEAFAKLKGPEASLALTRQAVLSPWSNIREAAAQKLKSRHEDEFMPALMSGLSTPIQTKTELYQAPDGRLVYNRAFYREGQDERQLAVFQTSFQRVGQSLGDSQLLGTRFGPVRVAADGSTQQRNLNYYDVTPPSQADLHGLRDALGKSEQATAVGQAMSDAANAQIDLRNTRICDALSVITDKNEPMSPEDWWRWWNDHNEVVLNGEKPLRGAYLQEAVPIVDLQAPSYLGTGSSITTIGAPPACGSASNRMFPGCTENRSTSPFMIGVAINLPPARSAPVWPIPAPITVPPGTPIMLAPAIPPKPGSPSLPMPGGGGGVGGGVGGGGGGSPFAPVAPDPTSCLPAGTPVWTESGVLAIEKIQVGDLVLSQNPETGELTYKPVLRTTVRPAASLFAFTAGAEEIYSTPGHAFWVDRSGWVRARQLEPGAQLHTVAGAAGVEYARQTGTIAPVYNLVVADFHTYFVGKTRILSHDITARKTIAATPLGQGEGEIGTGIYEMGNRK